MKNDKEPLHAFIKKKSKIHAVITMVSFMSIAIGIGSFAYPTYKANKRADKAEAALEAEKDIFWTHLGEYVKKYNTEIEFLSNANEFQFCDPRQMQKSLDLCADTVNENIQIQRENMRYLQYLQSCQDMVDDLIKTKKSLHLYK